MTDYKHLLEKQINEKSKVILLQNVDDKDEYVFRQRNDWGSNWFYLPKEWAEAILSATK